MILWLDIVLSYTAYDSAHETNQCLFLMRIGAILVWFGLVWFDLL